MPRAIPLPVRQTIWVRTQRGHCAREIATDLGVAYETVRKLVRRFRRTQAVLTPAYGRCGHNQRVADPGLVQAAAQMRLLHPGWGTELIRVLLQEAFPGRSIPAARTLRRSFARVGLSPAAAGRHARNSMNRARCVHQVWQMDAAEQMALADGTTASWLRIVDEFSGAVLQTVVFPPRELEPRGTRPDPAGTACRIYTLGVARPIACR